jgi:Zn-dependent peptidase ImmA (M78 family)
MLAEIKTECSKKNLKNKDVGCRLQKARQSGNFSIEIVSKLLQIPESVIEEIEDGQIEKYWQEIYGMLCIYGKPVHEIFEGFFENNQNYEIHDAPKTKYANYVIDSIKLIKQLHSRPIHLSSLPLARGKQNGKSINFSDENSGQKQRSVKKAVPTVLETRAHNLIHKNNLFKLPINVYQLAANLGIKVFFESLPNDLYDLRGFCYKEDNFSIIGINRKHHTVLQRFTIAHELHHLIYDLSDNRFLCGTHNENKIIELNAENFAAELLMPKSLVQKLVSHPPNIHYLTVNLVAKHFGVSYEAAAIRLEKFNLIPSASQVCKQSYRREDKQKTEFLLKNKLKYLIAVFGLETGIEEIQIDRKISNHSVCGAVINDHTHTVCWHCGLEIQEPKHNEIYLKNPYRQDAVNISSNKKVSSFEQKKGDKSDNEHEQLSLNLRI